jgi:hypothetical protein
MPISGRLKGSNPLEAVDDGTIHVAGDCFPLLPNVHGTREILLRCESQAESITKSKKRTAQDYGVKMGTGLGLTFEFVVSNPDQATSGWAAMAKGRLEG